MFSPPSRRIVLFFFKTQFRPSTPQRDLTWKYSLYFGMRYAKRVCFPLEISPHSSNWVIISLFFFRFFPHLPRERHYDTRAYTYEMFPLSRVLYTGCFFSRCDRRKPGFLSIAVSRRTTNESKIIFWKTV